MNQSTSHHRHGFSLTQNRESKAKKIIQILNEHTDHSIKNTSLLDIGTGNGEISYFLNTEFVVTSVDIEDQRCSKNGYSFLVANETLPFADNSFDIVVSNHVIEHVADQSLHLSEIARVLKTSGIVYLATPNRLWPWEVHYQVPFIHYLPNPVFYFLLKFFGIFHEKIKLLTWYRIKKLSNSIFHIHIFSDKVCKQPSRYFMSCSPAYKQFLSAVPLKIYTLLTAIHPTFILILEKKS